MNFKKIICLLLCFIISSFCLTGCDSNNDYVLYFELDSAPKTLDPQLANGTSEELLIKNLFEGLLRENSKGEIVKGAASDYTISTNGKTYTFTLRKNAKWSDGEALKAEDFVFAFERAVDPINQAPYATSLFSIMGAKDIVENKKDAKLGVTAIDDLTLKIELESPDKNFLHTLTTAICMPCRKDVYDKAKGQYGLVADRIVTNGSFKIRFWDKGDKFSLRINKFDDYNGKFEAEANAVIFSVGNTSGRAARIEKSNLDLGFVNYSETSKNSSVYTFEKSCYALMISKDSPFGSSDFRKAFAKSIHRNRLKNELGKVLKESACLIPNTVQLNGTSLSTQITVAVPPTYEPNEAHSLYISASKAVKDLPKKIDILYFGDQDVQNLALLVAENMQQALGAVVNAIPTDSEAALINSVAQGQYTLAIIPISAKNSEPFQFFEPFTKNSTGNIYGYGSDEFDEFVSKIKPNANNDVILEASESALNKLISKTTIIPLAMRLEAFSYSKEFSCPTISPFGGVIDLSLIRKVN